MQMCGNVGVTYLKILEYASTYLAFLVVSTESVFMPRINRSSLSKLFECDQIIDWKANSDGTVYYNKGTIWPNARVPYKFEHSFNGKAQAKFHKAIQNFQNHTCVQIVPKTSEDKAYVNVRLSSGTTTKCGSAVVCRRGGPQFIEITDHPNCISSNVMVHEIGHTLCLIHEETRPDRYLYLSYDKCPASTPPPSTVAIRNFSNHLYDYNSVMHGGCRNSCMGKPVDHKVKKCGADVNGRGLSVLDIDKINEYYNCQGCYAHRWLHIDHHDFAKVVKNLLNFGAHTANKHGLYMCRGYYNGDLLVGRYVVSKRRCYLIVDSKHGVLSGGFQVLTTPYPDKYVTNKSGRYKVYSRFDKSKIKHYTPVGRTEKNYKLFAAVAEVTRNGETRSILGYVQNKNWNSAIFLDGHHLIIKKRFRIFGCD